MSTRTQFDFVAPITYGFHEAQYELEESAESEGDARQARERDGEQDQEVIHADLGDTVEASEDVSQNDLGYFMSVAGGYQLLTAEDERALGTSLWRARSRLLRTLRRAARPRLAIDPRLGVRPVTPSTRRRLARVEKLARELIEGKTPSLPAGSRISRAFLRGARRRLTATVAELDEARGRLVEHNLRLVVWVAKRFRGRGFDFIDLIQEGSLGLMRAADRYDPRVGARFSTFATHWIQQGIRRALAEKARTIRIPVNRIAEVRQTLFLRGSLSEKLGRAPRPAEIAAEMNQSTSKVEELLAAIGRMESIDAPIALSERTLGDTLEDSSATPLERAMEEETRRTVKAVLDELPSRQRIILSMRHGIDYPHECTLDEIGDALGLSRERIRQVEKLAVASVRDWMRKHRQELARPH
jgi:RNA polymerase primary sigma factor